jgi:hypothetical protein
MVIHAISLIKKVNQHLHLSLAMETTLAIFGKFISQIHPIGTTIQLILLPQLKLDFENSFCKRSLKVIKKPLLVSLYFFTIFTPRSGIKYINRKEII